MGPSVGLDAVASFPTKILYEFFISRASYLLRPSLLLLIWSLYSYSVKSTTYEDSPHY
jgi:hypothetical protein